MINSQKKFDQAGCEYRSAIFGDNNRDSIRTISPTSVRAREGMENITTKNLKKSSIM